MKFILIAFLFISSLAFGQQKIDDLTVKKFTVINTKLGAKPCPLMSESQRDAIAIPESGDCIYNTTSLKLNTYDGSDWKAAGGGGIDAWITAFSYKSGNLTVHNKKIYSALSDHTSTIFSTDLAGGKWEEVSQGVSDHTQLSNIGTNSHVQIDAHIANNSNPHNVTKAQVGLGNVPNVDTSTTSNISDYLNKRFVLDSDLALISTIAGKQDRSTLTLKGDLYGATASATTARVPVGNSGELLTASPGNSTGLGYREVKENNALAFSFNGFEDISTWQKGNASAVVLPVTGSFAGTLQKKTSGPLNDSASYEYTQAAGSLNDYWCSPTKSITPAQKGETYFTANYTYDGQSGELQPYLYDVTNSGLINLVAIKGLGATNSSLVHAYAALIPQTTSQVSLCYQVKTLNSGKIFNYATVQLTKSLASLGVVSANDSQSTVLSTTNLYGSTNTGVLRFTTIASSNGSGIFTVDDTVASGTYIRFVKDANVSMTVSGVYGGANFYFISNVSGTIIPQSPSNPLATVSSGASTRATLTFNGKVRSGDFIFVLRENTSSTLDSLSRWTILATSENAQVASSNQITSSDSMVFVHKATAIVSTDPAGTINTYSYVANSNAASICATAPTQALTDMTLNGVRVFMRPYSASAACATPARVDIKIGTLLKDEKVFGFAGTGKTLPVFLDYMIDGNGNSQGVNTTYNEITGILSIDGAFRGGTASTANLKGAQSLTDTSYTSGYFVFNASTQPTISVIPNASLCTDFECTDNFIADVAGTSRTVSGITPLSWITSCTAASPVVCTVNTALALTTGMSCKANAKTTNNYVANVTATTANSITIYTVDAGTGTANSTVPFSLTCNKVYPDSKPKNFKQAGLNDISVSYWLSANFTASTSIPINFDSKEWDNCTPACVTVSPTAWRFTAPKDGVYTIVGRAESSSASYYDAYKGNSQYKSIGWHTSNAATVFSGGVKLLKGEYIDVRTSSSLTVLGGTLSTRSAAQIVIQRTGEY